MSSSEAVKKAVKKYNQEKVDRIIFRVPKGKKELIQSHAAQCQESLAAFINRAIDEAIERDQARK